MRLADKVAIVTGAGAGFGRGIAERFAEEGAKVLVNDIAEEDGGQVAAGIRAAGGEAQYIRADVTNGDDWARMVGQAEADYGGLDIIINNAGIPQRNMPMFEVDEANFDRIFDVNVKSIYWSALHGVPAMRKRGRGAFVNTSSTAALSPRPGLVWYNGSKGAVNTITKAMAIELASEQIRVNAVCPVAGQTQMLKEFMGGEETEEMMEKFRSTVPLGRFSTPRDIANAALYLASDEAEFITGVCMEVDGGRCI